MSNAMPCSASVAHDQYHAESDRRDNLIRNFLSSEQYEELVDIEIYEILKDQDWFSGGTACETTGNMDIEKEYRRHLMLKKDDTELGRRIRTMAEDYVRPIAEERVIERFIWDLC